ncbi:serine O-acetyltransferase [Nakamurella leprariae]|uniref:Serine acetyltransferase n=1 Tax=Nakamurella leprariae TaxID=2803911 RepID=A0A938YJR0_9ACTN|nr:hypothetical protein [Nakamurella leprariae]MBM9469143.1 hypothetical protein [Nakamurella leprariae]
MSTGPAPVGLRAALAVDLREFAKVKASGADPGRLGLGQRIDVLMMPGFWAVALWRLGTACRARGLRPVSRLCYVATMLLFGADLPAGARVGPGMVMPHPVGVTIASDVVFGARCRVMGGVRIGGSGNPARPGHPVLGDDVWLMDGSKVFGPVTIGDRTVVGSGALVARDVEADMFVMGPRSSTDVRPLAEVGLADHGGALRVAG